MPMSTRWATSTRYAFRRSHFVFAVLRPTEKFVAATSGYVGTSAAQHVDDLVLGAVGGAGGGSITYLIVCFPNLICQHKKTYRRYTGSTGIITTNAAWNVIDSTSSDFHGVVPNYR